MWMIGSLRRAVTVRRECRLRGSGRGQPDSNTGSVRMEGGKPGDRDSYTRAVDVTAAPSLCHLMSLRLIRLSVGASGLADEEARSTLGLSSNGPEGEPHRAYEI
eukprot:3937489-Rhodomonas_salina.1